MANYYADPTASGSEDGSSWANAFTTIQAAFDTVSEGDIIYTNSTESNPFRKPGNGTIATLSTNNVTIYTDRGPDSGTWVDGSDYATWTDAGGGIFSLVLAEEPSNVYYDFKRDDISGSVTGIDLTSGVKASYIDRACSFYGISESDLVAWYGQLIDGGATATPSEGEWGYTGGTLYINPPGSPDLATVNSLASYYLQGTTSRKVGISIDAQNCTITGDWMGLTMIRFPGEFSNGGYCVLSTNHGNTIRGVRGIDCGWHTVGAAINDTSNTLIENCIAINQRATSSGNGFGNPFVLFTETGGENLNQRIRDCIFIGCPHLLTDGSPVSTSNWSPQIFYAHTGGTSMTGISSLRMWQFDYHEELESKHGITLGGIGGGASSGNVSNPSFDDEFSWVFVDEGSFYIGATVARSGTRYVRCVFDGSGVRTNSSESILMSRPGNDFYRFEDCQIWTGNFDISYFNNPGASDFVELIRNFIYIQSTDAPHAFLCRGNNATKIIIRSCAIGSNATNHVVISSNLASNPSGPDVYSDSNNVFGPSFAGAYQPHINTAVPELGFDSWRSGVSGNVIGGSGDRNGIYFSVFRNNNSFILLSDGDSFESSSYEHSFSIVNLDDSSLDITVDIPNDVYVTESSDFEDGVPLSLSAGELKTLELKKESNTTYQFTINSSAGNSITILVDQEVDPSSTFNYGGYLFPIYESSFFTVSRSEGQNYQTLYIGSIPVESIVELGLTKFVTILQSEAEELQENVIGGAPLLSGRIGGRWYTVARPSGIADAEVEYFYKGNLLKAQRYGFFTYM